MVEKHMIDCLLNIRKRCRYNMRKTTNRGSNLHSAKKAKNDEFYTTLAVIENELKHYKHHFKDKVVYCNCDDPNISNFLRPR